MRKHDKLEDRDWQATMPLTKVAIASESVAKRDLGWQGSGFRGVTENTEGREWDESSEGSREVVMPESKPTHGDCWPLGELREICKPRLNGNGGLKAKVNRMLIDIGV